MYGLNIRNSQTGECERLTSQEIKTALNQNDREHRKHIAAIDRLEKHHAQYSNQDYDILAAAYRMISSPEKPLYVFGLAAPEYLIIDDED